MSMSPDLCAALEAAGVGPVLEQLTTSDDARISDAARGTLLHLGLLHNDAEATRGKESSVAQQGGDARASQNGGGSELDLDPATAFDVFLSHKRSDAKVSADRVERLMANYMNLSVRDYIYPHFISRSGCILILIFNWVWMH